MTRTDNLLGLVRRLVELSQRYGSRPRYRVPSSIDPKLRNAKCK